LFLLCPFFVGENLFELECHASIFKEGVYKSTYKLSIKRFDFNNKVESKRRLKNMSQLFNN